MGRLITVNNNSSDSDNKNAKKKISFDINSVKEQTADDSESSATKMPVFSIRKPEAKSAGTAEKKSEIENSQAPTSEQPVFEIHDDNQSQESNDASALSSNSPASAAPVVDDEATPQITVQSKIPADSNDAESENPKSDLDLPNDEEKSQPEVSSTSSEVVEANSSATEDQTSATGTDSDNIKASLDSIDSLTRNIAEIQKRLDAAAASAASTSNSPTMLRNDNSSSAGSADFSAPTNDSKPMTREAYRNSLNAVQNSEENFVEPKEEQPRGSHVARPHSSSPKKMEQAGPIIISPDGKEESQLRIRWSGPETKPEEKQPVKKVEHRETSHQQSVTRRSSHHAKQKQSGVLGKSFLAMFGIGNKK